MAYLRLVVDVPGERNGIIRDLLNVADGVEAFFVVGYEGQTEKAAVTSQSNGTLSQVTVRASVSHGHPGHLKLTLC